MSIRSACLLLNLSITNEIVNLLPYFSFSSLVSFLVLFTNSSNRSWFWLLAKSSSSTFCCFLVFITITLPLLTSFFLSLVRVSLENNIVLPLLNNKSGSLFIALAKSCMSSFISCSVIFFGSPSSLANCNYLLAWT